MKKKSSESYTDFGTRIIKFKNDLIKMAKYKEDDNKFVRRKTNIEDEALKLYIKSLRKHLTLVFKYGDPKTIQEAREMVEKAEERFEFSEEEDSEDEQKKKKEVNKIKARENHTAKCQCCNLSLEENSHEALTCTLTACVYCRSSMHICSCCNVVPEYSRLKMTCKLCFSSSHTIDLCPDKIPNTTYCQYCQSHTCYATKCEKIRRLKVCAMCGDTEHEAGTNCFINNANAGTQQNQNFRRTPGPCFNCQGPHNVNQCPQRQQ